MPAETLTCSPLASHCEAFFDAALTRREFFSEILASDAAPRAGVDTGRRPQLSLVSLFLAGESLRPNRDYFVIVRVRLSPPRYHFLLPDAVRSASRDTTAGVRVFDMPVGSWPGAGADLSLLVYRTRRHRGTDRVLGRLRDLVEHADCLAETHGTMGLSNSAFELVELLERSGTTDLLLGGTIAVPDATAEERFVAVVPARIAPGILSIHSGRLVSSESTDTATPVVGRTHALLRIGPPRETTDVRRHIEKLRRQAQMRQQFTLESGGESYLSYLEKEVKERRQETIAAMYGDFGSKLPVVTPVALEAANNLTDVVTFEEGEETPFKTNLEAMRARIYEELGVRMPGVRVRLNEADFPDGIYLIMINEVPLVSGTVYLDKLLCNASVEALTALNIRAEAARRPDDGTDAAWVDLKYAPLLAERGYKTWDAGGYMMLHLDSVLRKNAVEFFGIDEVLNELGAGDGNAERRQELIRKIRGAEGGIVRFRQMLASLLDEGLTCEPIVELAELYLELAQTGPAYEVAEELRLLPRVHDELIRDADRWTVYPLAEDCAAAVRSHVKRDGDAVYVAMPPELTQEFLSAVRQRIGDLPPSRRPVIVVESPKIRRLVRRIVELEFPYAKVIAQRELEGLDPAGLSYGPEITRG